MLLFFIVVLAAIAFEYSNGFHDAANAIATVVSTKVLSPRQAIVLAAGFNLFGAFLGTAVAKRREGSPVTRGLRVRLLWRQSTAARVRAPRV